MRFGLKCIVALAILYRAIIMSQGGTGTATLSSTLAGTLPRAQARVHEEIAARVGGWCRSDPAACLGNAARLTRFVAGDPAMPPAASRRTGAVAAPTR